MEPGSRVIEGELKVADARSAVVAMFLRKRKNPVLRFVTRRPRVSIALGTTLVFALLVAAGIASVALRPQPAESAVCEPADAAVAQGSLADSDPVLTIAMTGVVGLIALGTILIGSTSVTAQRLLRKWRTAGNARFTISEEGFGYPDALTTSGTWPWHTIDEVARERGDILVIRRARRQLGWRQRLDPDRAMEHALGGEVYIIPARWLGDAARADQLAEELSARIVQRPVEAALPAAIVAGGDARPAAIEPPEDAPTSVSGDWSLQDCHRSIVATTARNNKDAARMLLSILQRPGRSLAICGAFALAFSAMLLVHAAVPGLQVAFPLGLLLAGGAASLVFFSTVLYMLVIMPRRRGVLGMHECAIASDGFVLRTEVKRDLWPWTKVETFRDDAYIHVLRRRWYGPQAMSIPLAWFDSPEAARGFQLRIEAARRTS